MMSKENYLELVNLKPYQLMKHIGQTSVSTNRLTFFSKMNSLLFFFFLFFFLFDRKKGKDLVFNQTTINIPGSSDLYSTC